MDTAVHSPFAALTMIVAPAMLTNASCVLALSTINRMLRTRESMRELLKDSADPNCAAEDVDRNSHHVDRVERQAMFLMKALGCIYVALAAFALATLVSLVGAAFAEIATQWIFRVLGGIAFTLGVIGVSGLVIGCANLFRATKLSLAGIREEAAAIRERHRSRRQN